MTLHALVGELADPLRRVLIAVMKVTFISVGLEVV